MSKTNNTLPAVLAAAEATDDPLIEQLLGKATPEEQRALVRSLRAAYEAGQEAADQRTGKLMARIFGGFVGVTPGIDVGHNGDDRNPRHRLRDMVRLLAGVAGQGPNV